MTRLLLLLVACLFATVVFAQTPVGMVADACPPPMAMPAATQRFERGLIEPGKSNRLAQRLTPEDKRELAAYAAEQKRAGEQDWPQLCRYQADNHALQGAAPVRTVFIGDSITELWALADPALFNASTIDRGISGQTSAQMLLRFQADVVALHPRVVHILAGTNDIAGNTGPTTAQDYKNNIMAMVEMARANGIAVVLGSIPPAKAMSWRPGFDPVPWIAQLNAWLADYAREQGISVVDYHAALAQGDGFVAGLSNDGVHPNRSGFARMTALVRPLIEREAAAAR